ncbi:MAG TPA: TIGR03545 family protein [Gemmatimonadaceae bacterium]|nr:TIGR03545 family protein [Gemmatimonadaceae bacterium]
MSTPGSVRSGEHTQYTPAAPGGGPRGDSSSRRARTRVFRWEGIIPLLLVLALLGLGWMLFAERFMRDTIAEAGTKALGAQLDIADLDIHLLSGSLELHGVALADPYDRNRNLFEIRVVRVVLDPEPLLEKKIVVKTFTLGDIATGTKRATPATAVTGEGFAPRAMAEMQRFAKQFTVPLLSLIPIDTLKALVLNPAQLKSVQTALAVAQQADSVKQSIELQYAQLRVQETVDSSRALVARLQGTNVRTLGVDGARRAIDDVRRTSARVDSAKRRVDALMVTARRGLDSLQTGVGAIDEARRDDYAFARGLLKLPSFEGPDLGSAVFGRVTIDRFQKALYWTSLARQYAPPGLLPKESPGPKRLRRSGTTVHFVEPKAFPRFWLQRADVNVAVTSGSLGGTYAFAARDVTSDPAIVGRPMLFALRRSAKGNEVDSLRVVGSLDHTGATVRESVTAQAAGVALPTIAIPSLPYSMGWGRGSSELRIALTGDQLSGRWYVHSPKVTWAMDSAKARPLNTMETLVARVLTGITTLDMTADISGTLENPRLSVKSNLDRQLSEQLRSVAGKELAKAEARARAQVDRIVEEKSAPVRARVAELRTDAERRIGDARTKLDEEKRKLDERLKALTGGVIGLPKLPGM